MARPRGGAKKKKGAPVSQLHVADSFLFLFLAKVAERELACKAARGTPAEEKRRQALDKARARAAEIGGRRDLDAKLGKMMLDQQNFEEVSGIDVIGFPSNLICAWIYFSRR